jgi:glycogen debranching enzyme
VGDRWAPGPQQGDAASLTLVEGPSFCISSRNGDLARGGSHGLFFLDTRFVSQLELFVNGLRPEPLAVVEHDPFGATFIARGTPPSGQRDSTVLVERHRWIGRGLREDVVVRNLADEATYLQVELSVEADFADVSDVRAGIPSAEAGGNVEVVAGGLNVTRRRGGAARGVRLQFSGEPAVTPGRIRYEAIVAARGEWRCCIEVVPVVDGDEIEPRYRCGEPVEQSTPTERLERWRQGVPEVETDHPGLARVLKRSAEDLGSLRLFDPELPERAVVAAGAPWAMSLFGRDSLITAWMALLFDPDIALGVLETLARFQGQDLDPRTEEQPGRILHEMRFGGRVGRSLGGGSVYYGSVDATPLFVMLLGELRRWGLASELVERLLPHVDRALAWIEDFGDLDGDGYVEYQRANDRGLLHQGWKDSPDAVRYADGRGARPPIALAEVQGYVYSAYLARAHFAREAGDDATVDRYRTKATELRTAFNRDFWLEERGCIAMGLDRNKEPIDAVASNMGHCLWTGILDADKAAAVAERLLSPDLFSGWGIRTLGRSMTGYNPISYQAGSVWPHDNALAAAGLMRYGFVEPAQRVIMAQLDAALALDARLPELFSGLDRDELTVPIVYPSSCSPQAWAAAAPLLSLRTLLRFDPWIPAGKLWLSPVLPDPITLLHLERVPLLGGRISVLVDGGVVKVEGLPLEVEVISEGRDPITSFE